MLEWYIIIIIMPSVIDNERLDKRRHLEEPIHLDSQVYLGRRPKKNGNVRKLLVRLIHSFESSWCTLQCSQAEVGESGATGHCCRPWGENGLHIRHINTRVIHVNPKVHLRSKWNAGVVEESVVLKRKVARGIRFKGKAGVKLFHLSTRPPAWNVSLQSFEVMRHVTCEVTH